jgi:hypothetical protein
VTVEDPDEEILEYPGEAASVEAAVEVATEVAAANTAVTAAPVVVQEPAPVVNAIPPIEEIPAAETAQHAVVSIAATSVAPSPASPVTPRKPLFWSVDQVGLETEKPAEADRSHVPPMLRNLKKCVACGFPVSAERMLCVECEEKKWRGQLRKSVVANQSVGRPAAPVATPGARGSAVAAAPAKMAPEPVKSSTELAHEVVPDVELKSAEVVGPSPMQMPQAAEAKSSKPPEFVLSSGLEPSQSWFSRNKFILGAIVVVAAAVVAILLLR